MGWTEYQAKYYKNGKIDRKAECDAELKWNGHLEVLKSAMVGTTYYAAVKNLSNNSIFAAVWFTSTRDNKWFSFFPQTEFMVPNRHRCPKSIFNMLTETDDEGAKMWRRGCKMFYGEYE